MNQQKTEWASELVTAIAEAGRSFPSRPDLQSVEIFEHYFDNAGQLADLDKRDGACSRRELLIRYLLLNAVLDQGPDTAGVRMLLVQVTNELYRREVRFLHRPEDFFKELGIAVDQITGVHAAVTQIRASEWAKANQSRASKYNLFLDNTRQVLGYAMFRWGTSLAVPLLLTKDAPDGSDTSTVLLNYLQTWPSAEIMSQRVKDHNRYGLGKAIGDKAAHLFAKWIVYSYALLTRDDPSWGPYSFEVPFDSNAGRVLWRTGFLLQWASEEEYRKWEVIQPGRGKGGLHYLRITNIRSNASSTAAADTGLAAAYRDLCVNHLRTHRKAPKTIEIQRIPAALLLFGRKHKPGELDDGLMHIGTEFCFNHDEPLCEACPVAAICKGHLENPDLILSYRT
ncbi:MAG: hypothetical protein QHH80_09755 [Anaerolineae bacterium]|jgi:hypothetical protein|nr:hypothetical protein [Anaerolineae bacterium]